MFFFLSLSLTRQQDKRKQVNKCRRKNQVEIKIKIQINSYTYRYTHLHMHNKYVSVIKLQNNNLLIKTDIQKYSNLHKSKTALKFNKIIKIFKILKCNNNTSILINMYAIHILNMH